MATLDERYRVNGLVDTSRPALENLEKIVTNCNTWLTYDGITGQWGFVINQAGDPVASFTDDNIVGAINLSINELAEFYNSVEVKFHNRELRDQDDFVLLEIPEAQRLGAEPDNRLTIDAPFINDQIQAQLLGLIELKQSRLEKMIEFSTDYSQINLQSGNIIEITNSVYGWTNQLFRVIRIDETEEDGTIVLKIKAQEYRASVYGTSDLFQYITEKEDGIFQLNPLQDASPLGPLNQLVDLNGNPVGVNSPYTMLNGLDQMLRGQYGPTYQAIQALNSSKFIAGTNMAIDYNSGAGTLTFSSTGGGGGTGALGRLIYVGTQGAELAPSETNEIFLPIPTVAQTFFTIAQEETVVWVVDLYIVDIATNTLVGNVPAEEYQINIAVVNSANNTVYQNNPASGSLAQQFKMLRKRDYAKVLGPPVALAAGSYSLRVTGINNSSVNLRSVTTVSFYRTTLGS